MALSNAFSVSTWCSWEPAAMLAILVENGIVSAVVVVCDLVSSSKMLSSRGTCRNQGGADKLAYLGYCRHNFVLDIGIRSRDCNRRTASTTIITTTTTPTSHATMSLPIREVKPKNAKTKRYLENKGPQGVENAKSTLFLRYTTCSEIVQLVLKDLSRLKEPLVVKFTKKESKHPFEDATSFEFWADKNDTSLMVYGSHSKKRPHCLTLMRMFGYKVLDMLELLIDPETFRSLSQFKNAKAAVGLKPLLSFSGSAFESPIQNDYTLAKSLLLDLFKGSDTDKVDVEGLKYMIHFTVDEEEQEGVKPQIHMRSYLISSRKGQTSSLPKIDVEEMGPRIDFRIGRKQDADPDMLKEAMRKPKTTEVSCGLSQRITRCFASLLCCIPLTTLLIG